MAWVAEDDFNSYGTGDLNGGSGGGGWGANWSGSVNFDTTTSPTWEGSDAITNASGSNISRNIVTALSTDGHVVYFAMRKTSTSAGGNKVRFTSSGTIRAQIMLNSSGNCTATTSGGTSVFTGYSANTWYAFKVTLDVSSGTYDVDYSTDAYGAEGTWTAGASGISLENSGNIDNVQFDSDTGNTNYWDYISGTSPYRGVGITHSNTYSNGGTATTNVVSSVANTGTDRVMVCSVAYKDAGGGEVTGVAFNAAGGDEAFTQLGSESKNGEANSQLWYLAGGSDETANVTVSTTNSVRQVAVVNVYTGVDQANPFREAANASANGTNGTVTVDVTALDTEVVVDAMAQVSAGPDTVSSQSGTGRGSNTATGGGTDTIGASQSITSTGATETMSYTMSSTDNWATSAGALQKTIQSNIKTRNTVAIANVKTANTVA
jgi:hypothetical protein